MESNELIKKINELVVEAFDNAKKAMQENATSLSMEGTAAFYKAAGRLEIAEKIKQLIIKEGGLP